MLIFRCIGGVALLLAALAVLSSHPVDCDSRTTGGLKVQWQILTKVNYSSQIRLHHHLLLLVTVPWSGESRSLMNELAHAVASDEHRFGALKLMVLNRNAEKMLADSLGADGGTTFFYLRNAIAYKYSGRLRVQHILSSVHYGMSLLPDEMPFKALATPEDLRRFLHSTDKAVLLLEFCGWTSKLLAADGTLAQHNLDSNRMNNGSFIVEAMDNWKDIQDDRLICSTDSEFNELYGLSQLTSINEGIKNEGTVSIGYGHSCTKHESEQFKAFFQKFSVLARDFFLPPERHRFALVTEKSLLPLLNIEEPAPWLMAVYFAGCPSCSNFLKEVDHLRNILQSQISPVLELEDVINGVETTLPSEGPAMLLFVDRSSDSMQVRRESHEALASFREFAGETVMYNGSQGYQNMRHERASIKTNRLPHSIFKHPRLQTLAPSRKIVLSDKLSAMIMKDGKQVTLKNFAPELQGSSVREILNFALKQNELKLSSVAKNVGFQLLSPDFEIEVVESVPPKSEDQPDQGEPTLEQLLTAESTVANENPHVFSDVGPITIEDEDVESRFSSHEVHPSGTIDEEECAKTGPSGIDENEDQYFSRFFYFIDGNYRLLETLTGELKVPSVVIIDPHSQKHYVLAEHIGLNHSTLSMFVKDFHAGRLLPYIQSHANVHGSEDVQRPPFVNLDFHEKGSIPLLTGHTFAELVYGNTSDPKNYSNSLNKDVLVLFGNDWCGFCKRMELVVREVYRAVKACADLKINNSRKEKWMTDAEHVGDTTSKMPLIYMMDCTLSDCSVISKRALQRETYPLLLLFPAGKKNETISYEGDIAVRDIMNFLVSHGSNIRDIILDESVLQDLVTVKQSPQSRSLHHEVILKDINSDAVTEHHVTSKLPFTSHATPHLSAGCILIATENLMDIRPFDESKILIVKADETTGVQGLIINKPFSWDSLQQYEQYFELLKDVPLQFGGPVVIHGLPLVALTHKAIESTSTEVLPNVHFIDPVGTLSLLEDIRVDNYSVHDFWFFLGYCGWEWEQLFAEIHRGDWNVTQGDWEWAWS